MAKYTNTELLERLINDKPIPFVTMMMLKLGFALMRIKSWVRFVTRSIYWEIRLRLARNG